MRKAIILMKVIWISFVFLMGNMTWNDTSIIDGVQLDVWVVNSSQLERPEEYLHIINNEVLFDSRGESAEFLDGINRIYEEGPEPISENQRKFIRSWLIKMQKRSLHDDTEGLYRYHWMLTESLEMYFKLNNLWFLGVKKIIALARIERTRIIDSVRKRI